MAARPADGADPLEELRERLRPFGPPLVLFNKSHSGSRLLARAFGEAGVFLGARVNESEDALPLLDLVRHAVERYYPDYGPLWRDAGARGELARVAADVFRRHLEGLEPGSGRPWGWKLCETGYALPVVDALFPAARYVHLIRDGRDVAFCDHVAPKHPFWRKVYFDTAGITSWGRLSTTQWGYRLRGPLHNAVHWCNAVRVGRTYGQMLRERYHEVRYEELCGAFEATVGRLFADVGLPAGAAARAVERLGGQVRRDSVGRHAREPGWRVRRVVEVEKPLLVALGYLPPEPGAPV